MRYFFFSLCFISSALLPLPSRDVRGNHTQNFLHLQGTAKVKLGKSHYHFGDNIDMDFSITNLGDEVLRIYPIDKEFTTFQLIVIDEDDEKARRLDELRSYPSSKSNKTKIENLAGDEVKEIILHSKETYTKKIRLTDLFELKPGKKYFVYGYFYPNFREENLFLKSGNTVFFHLEKRLEEGFVPNLPSGDLSIEGISPEETIFLFLGAEMKKNWENYYKYINFSEYILSYDRFAKEYADSEPQTKQVVIEGFKRYLTENKFGKLKYYKILSVNRLNNSLSKVNVFIEREDERIPVKFEYQYTLKKSDDSNSKFWKISNLVVKVRK